MKFETITFQDRRPSDDDWEDGPKRENWNTPLTVKKMALGVALIVAAILFATGQIAN
ncbi:hypothetical protein KGO06_00265 [Patescibacteria group bacterium]|nr:hypothetical protein [Patescibacteria group bacterium]